VKRTLERQDLEPRRQRPAVLGLTSASTEASTSLEAGCILPALAGAAPRPWPTTAVIKRLSSPNTPGLAELQKCIRTCAGWSSNGCSRFAGACPPPLVKIASTDLEDDAIEGHHRPPGLPGRPGRVIAVKHQLDRPAWREPRLDQTGRTLAGG